MSSADTLLALNTAQKYSVETIQKLRGLLLKIECDEFAVVTSGSFARKEASAESDIDFFVVARDSKKEFATSQLASLKGEISRLVKNMPSTDGAFGTACTETEIVTNIGGSKDSNETLTRRMLYLLETDYLTSQSYFEAIRTKLLEKYIRESLNDHQLAKFLLNDLIRYYRTICVDFEHKTAEVGKPWGIRNIKLVFSRKLLYFSGILVVAESYQRTHKEKLDRASRLFSMTPIDRIRSICGADCESVLRYYDRFLTALEQKSFQ